MRHALSVAVGGLAVGKADGTHFSRCASAALLICLKKALSLTWRSKAFAPSSPSPTQLLPLERTPEPRLWRFQKGTGWLTTSLWRS